MPIFMRGFSNFLIPLQCGTSKMMYPRANNFAFQLLVGSYSTLHLASGSDLPDLRGAGVS